MDKKRVFIAGHRGMVGSAIVRQLENRNDIELIIRDRTELDLMSQSAVQKFFATEKIDDLLLKKLMKSIWLRQKWGGFRPIIIIRQSSSTKT
nr:NAD-dependent epimerase/dehydratase family protein [Yersinia pestis]